MGVDPGLSGGLAFLDFDELTLHVYPMPTKLDDASGDKIVDAMRILTLLRRHAPECANVEEVGAMPHDGVVSAFSFGFRTGVMRGVLDVYQAETEVFPIHRVRPSVWKPAMKCTASKSQTGSVAHKMLPKCHSIIPISKDGLVEASLLAIYLAFLQEDWLEKVSKVKQINPKTWTG